jgi:DNA-directed RNA polymerase specialized sigma24 family protein
LLIEPTIVLRRNGNVTVSVTEGDDAVQEAWLRLSRSDTRGVQNLGGWLTTVVVREVNFRELLFWVLRA